MPRALLFERLSPGFTNSQAIIEKTKRGCWPWKGSWTRKNNYSWHIKYAQIPIMISEVFELSITGPQQQQQHHNNTWWQIFSHDCILWGKCRHSTHVNETWFWCLLKKIFIIINLKVCKCVGAVVVFFPAFVLLRRTGNSISNKGETLSTSHTCVDTINSIVCIDDYALKQ